MRNRLKNVVTAKATPITTTCWLTPRRPSVRPEPTRFSTAWLANVAPRNASGAMRSAVTRAGSPERFDALAVFLVPAVGGEVSPAVRAAAVGIGDPVGVGQL